MSRRNTIIDKIKNIRKSKKMETTEDESCEQSFYDPDRYLNSLNSLNSINCLNSPDSSPTPSINSLSSNDSILDYCVKIK